MTIVHLPDELARRLEAEAVRRGVSFEQLPLETLEGRYGTDSATNDDVDALEAFIGAFDSGDAGWASTDTHELRRAAARRTA